MISYATNTHGKTNLAALRSAGWRIFLTPGKDRTPPAGFQFAIDNGAWRCFKHGLPFESEKFETLIETHGAAADFVIIPDIVAGGNASLEFSKLWIDRLRHFRRILLPVQDGMTSDDVGAILRRHPNMGIFLGGSTEWKLRTMYGWGMVAHALGCYYHVGRVNTVKRVRLCAEAGAHSTDGTSASMYSVNLPKLDVAHSQASLLTPAMVEDKP
jgi:hypothetical protein